MMKVNEILNPDLPIAFDIIQNALAKGRTVVFDSFFAGKGNRAEPMWGKVISLSAPNKSHPKYSIRYYEWIKDKGTWDSREDWTGITEQEFDGIVFVKSDDDSLRFFLPNHDVRKYKP